MSLNLPDSTHKTTSSTDEELLARIASRDPQGMSRLYDRYAGLVYRIGLHILRDAEAAECVLHDVFLTVWRDPNQCLAQSIDLATCLAVITSHHARQVILPAPPGPESADNVTVIDHRPTGLRAKVPLANPFWKAVYSLTAGEQLLLELAFLRRMPLEQISIVTGESLQSLRLHIKKNISKLRIITRQFPKVDTDLSA